ncbi:MAG TPA: M23 family metallopeptidase, partial [Candidatus Saccharimonadia bacterium]|nr:M23 family metallopeptidase [Candidatus Saccharimonadia bacterium]
MRLRAGLAAVLSCAASAHAACPLDLPRDFGQGSLVIGRTGPGCSVTVDGRAVRVASDGRFVFGIARDARRVALATGDGTRVARAIAPRAYRVEHVDGVPPATVAPPPAIAARIAREQARVAKAREHDADRADFGAGFVRPVAGRTSGVYGSTRVLNGTPKDPHYGLDLAAPTGTLVRAPAAGVVTLAEKDLYLTGGTVLLDHGHGVSSVFLHLSRVDVAVGARVARGAPLGAVGATGRASGPHLHWGL